MPQYDIEYTGHDDNGRYHKFEDNPRYGGVTVDEADGTVTIHELSEIDLHVENSGRYDNVVLDGTVAASYDTETGEFCVYDREAEEAVFVYEP